MPAPAALLGLRPGNWGLQLSAPTPGAAAGFRAGQPGLSRDVRTRAEVSCARERRPGELRVSLLRRLGSSSPPPQASQ